MITTNATSRVFFIKSDFGTGTGFTVEFKGKQFLTTARHLFRADTNKPAYSKVINHKDKVDISIFHDGQWENLNCTINFHKVIDIDVAVLEIPADISPRNILGLNSEGMRLGQDAYFLGFPFQMFGEGANINNKFPFPFVKKCVLSAFNKGQNDEVIFYFDGHNNPGFSGGPIIFQDDKSKELRICAIVRGYIQQKGEIDLKTSLANYTENSGIILGYNSKHATEILESM